MLHIVTMRTQKVTDSLTFISMRHSLSRPSEGLASLRTLGSSSMWGYTWPHTYETQICIFLKYTAQLILSAKRSNIV